MTKYLLHGGVDKNKREKYFELNQDYFIEGVRGFENVKILAVYFARTESDTETDLMFENDEHCFEDHSPQIKMEFAKASKDLNEFRKQVQWADLIYVIGGDSKLLLNQLKQVPDFATLIKGKVYMGSSAGANVVAKYFFSNTDQTVIEGLGLRPIKVLSHWDGSGDAGAEKLQSTGGDLPLYKIPEYEFIILETED